MPRMFMYLALFSLTAVVATAMVGFGLRVEDIRDPLDLSAQAARRTHFMAGVVSGVIVLLVNSVAFTYFMGTSRWCKEVCETYKLDFELVRRSAQLKRRTLPVAVISMLTIVGMAALGAAADPMAALTSPGFAGVAWSEWHLIGTMLGLATIAVGYFLEWQYISGNHEIIQIVLAEVAQMRRERGLD